jgi:hypothetical protein
MILRSYLISFTTPYMMKKHIFKYTFLCLFFLSNAQKENSSSFIDVNMYSGNIARHNDNITHLIQGHPNGFIIGWNKRVSGEKIWHSQYNYPEFGASFVAQNFNNSMLGSSYGVYGHYNFYFLKRRLMLRFAQGISYATNPYDKLKNPKNIAFGSDLLSGTYLMLNYVRPQIFGPIGVQAGAILLHLSNANIKAPNTSINSVTFNVGLTAALDSYKETKEIETFNEDINKKIRFGLIFRTGVNQSDVVGTPQFPFYIFSAFAEKRINPKSLVMIGGEYFNSKFLKEYIYYQSVAYPENNIAHDLDYKRIGVYIGHELLFGRFSVQTQLGYYVYSPFDFEGRVYNRIGVKYYLSSKWFVSATLKSHTAKAEALEFSLGIRL